jgi:hypothetical protein
MSADNTSKAVASQVAIELGLTGDYWIAIIQALLALSKSVRSQMHGFLTAQVSLLRTQLKSYAAMTSRADYLSENISTIHGAVTAALLPVDNLLRTSPLDSVFYATPELKDIYEDITSAVPLSLPTEVTDVINSVIGADFFEGVSSYSDLRDKLDELQFKAARATSLRNYADKGVVTCNSQIDKVQKIIDILVVLDY